MASAENGLLGLSEDIVGSCVLSRLESIQDLVNARLVCRRWSSLAPLSMKTLVIAPRWDDTGRKQDTGGSSAHLCRLLPSLPNLEGLGVEKAEGGFDTWHCVSMVALAAAQHCPRLRRFRYRTGRPACIGAPVLLYLLRKCPLLEDLHVDNLNSSFCREEFQKTLAISDPSPFLQDPGGEEPIILPRKLALPLGQREMIGVLEGADKSQVEKLRLQFPMSELDRRSPLVQRNETPQQFLAQLPPRYRQSLLNMAPPLRLWQDEHQDFIAAQQVVSFVVECSSLKSLHLQHFFPNVDTVRKMEILGSLGQLEHLTELRIQSQLFERSQGVYQLPSSFRNLWKLRKLQLETFRSLRGIDLVLELPDLRELTLINLMNMGVPERISRLTSLEKLVVYGALGGLSFPIPESIGGLSSLKVFFVNGLRITTLPDSMGLLHNLESLVLFSCRRLKGLPSSVAQLPRLKYLDHGGTGILGTDPVVQVLKSRGVNVTGSDCNANWHSF